MPVRQRNLSYQTAALAFLSAAVASLLLPPTARLGYWLPLHLTVAGAVAVAISGAMQVFARTLTATPEPPPWVSWMQFSLVVGGAIGVAVGLPTHTPWITAIGGASWTVAIASLGWFLWRAWSRSLSRRHAMSIVAYALAVSFAVLGGALGATLGRGGLAPSTYLTVRHVHMTVNVFGFASLTIVGTMVTLLPTVLRVRMVAWRGFSVLVLLALGVAVASAGWAVGSARVAAAGGILEAAGASTFGALVLATVRSARRWAVPSAAFHLVAGVSWFVVGSIWYAAQLLRGAPVFDAWRSVFLVVFVWGWLVQVLLGAWAYLLPLMRPGGPDEHRAGLQVFELGGRTQAVLLNIGIALLALAATTTVPSGWGALGWVLALASTLAAIAKTWLFSLVAPGMPAGRRGRAVWGG
jgi:nitrite reductase (NO-forming)